MRLTEKELLEQRPWWNTKNPVNGDIVSVLYGDIPHQRYTHDRVRMECSDRFGYVKENSSHTGYLDDTDHIISSINATDHYIYSRHGEFSKYYTLIGGVRVFSNWFIGTVDLNLKYNGKTYNLSMCDLYGTTILSLTLNTATIYRVFEANQDLKWISTKYEKMSKEEALKVVDVKRVKDYGKAIQLAVEKCRKIIEEY